ncbi:uncharacterized protein TRUGW13939_00759 [Talaromyces rugulosus]|uniref:Uncharacterized protein n=1 Tax=Talaromyces rugulosus TaxID=121627 RepID=A0A7H8QI68_TALRU|nr:uncharacterized protein TRUGW13939_00759 [Talaromyces rugulosus]QKX53679.1 hypothetical protein TRUGW13939_00759 [Talaromyces rugulosus]
MRVPPLLSQLKGFKTQKQQVDSDDPPGAASGWATAAASRPSHKAHVRLLAVQKWTLGPSRPAPVAHPYHGDGALAHASSGGASE